MPGNCCISNRSCASSGKSLPVQVSSRARSKIPQGASLIPNSDPLQFNPDLRTILSDAVSCLASWHFVVFYAGEQILKSRHFIHRHELRQKMTRDFRRGIAIEALRSAAPGFNGAVETDVQDCVFRGFQQGFEQVLASRSMGDQYLALFSERGAFA
jgi:hypothetical protein